MKYLQALNIILSLCIISGPLYAQDFYVCNSGSDSNPGMSPSKPLATFDFAMTKFNTLKAGDSVLLCRNGTFTSANPRLFNQNCKPELPCTIADYTAPNSPANTTPPLIKSSNGTGVIKFEDGGPADHDGGYQIKNLYLKGAGKGYGIFLFNDIDSLTVENVVIDGFEIGMYSAGANGPSAGANQVNENITLRNSTITNNSGQGWLGGCNNCLIDNNKFINNGYAKAIYNHNLYISGSNNFGITVSNNTLYKSAFVAGKCSGVSLVVHGVLTGLTIKSNKVYEDLNAANATCWGISVDPGYATEESFTNVLIANNTITNVGNVGIGCASCTDVQIKSNNINHAQDFSFTGIVVPVRAEDSVKSDRIKISGNFIDLTDTNKRGKVAIKVPATGSVNIGTNKILSSK
jgi:hypothetical protein